MSTIVSSAIKHLHRPHANSGCGKDEPVSRLLRDEHWRGNNSPRVPAKARTKLTTTGLASKLRPIGALEPEHRARLFWRCHLIAELLDQAARLRDLLGVACRELAAADIQAVLETDAHVAAHHHRLGGEWHLVAAGPEHRPGIIVAEQLVGGALHEHEIVHVRPYATENAEDQLQEDRRFEPAPVDAVGEIVEVPDVVAFVLELGAVSFAHEL